MTITVKQVDELRRKLGSIETPMMRGDNLAVTLCSNFDNPDQDEDEHGWTPDAIKGCDEVLDAIHAHYATAMTAPPITNEQIEAEIVQIVAARLTATEIKALFSGDGRGAFSSATFERLLSKGLIRHDFTFTPLARAALSTLEVR